MIRAFVMVGYCLCAVLGLVLYLISRRAPERISPFSELLDRVMTSRAARVTIFVFWWWLGWHFLFAHTV